MTVMWVRGLNWAMFVMSAVAQDVTPPPVVDVTSERLLRKWAINLVRPIYPADAIRKRAAGVAVAEVELSENGTVRRVRLLEAPSTSISEAVATAVAKWQFKPPSYVNPDRLMAKLTFYFVIQGKNAFVWYPSEAPYVGRWRAPAKKVAGKP